MVVRTVSEPAPKNEATFPIKTFPRIEKQNKYQISSQNEQFTLSNLWARVQKVFQF